MHSSILVLYYSKHIFISISSLACYLEGEGCPSHLVYLAITVQYSQQNCSVNILSTNMVTNLSAHKTSLATMTSP